MYALKASSRKPIVACSYGDTIGPPVLFDKSFFSQLLSLNGPEGAKKLLLQHPGQVAVIDFTQGAVDIDTNGDYQKLLNI